MAFTVASLSDTLPTTAVQASEGVQTLEHHADYALNHNDVDGHAVGISQTEDLMNAAFSGKVAVVEYLIDNGAKGHSPGSTNEIILYT